VWLWAWSWPPAAIPDAYRSGDVIDGLDGVDADDLKVFHAGTRLEDGRW
jgi:phosphoribosylamine-glycine ligase